MATVKKRRWLSGGAEKEAWVVYYADQNKKRHIKTFKTKRKAEAWRIEAGHEIARGTHTPAAASITVAEAGKRWLDQCKIDGLEAATLLQYRQHLDLHIAPLIGALRLAQLSTTSVSDFRNALIAQGRSRIMAGKVIVSLGAILDNAMTDNLIAQNVVRSQATGRAKRARRVQQRHTRRLEVGVDLPTQDELKAILRAAEGYWRPLVVTAIFTGLRASELRGLPWKDVDFDKAELHVRQRADRFNVIGSPKSEAGKRTVPLAPFLVNTLREWRLACPKGKLDLVFPNGQGNVETLSNIAQRGLGPIEKAAGVSERLRVPRYGLHAFRHAAASLLIAEGQSPKRIQVVMGHSSIKVTFDTYGHLFPSPEDDHAAMQRLQARLLG
jgi:integrase